MIGYTPINANPGRPIDVDVDMEKIPVYFITLIISVFAYFFLKLGMTLIFCRDKYNSTRLKTLEESKLPIFPVCFCREAFKIWQTVVMYAIPIIIIYVFMFMLCIFPPIDVFLYGTMPFEEVDAGYMTMLFFMSFFFAFDLTLIAYTLFYKVKNRINYIAVDYHIYGVTLFRKTYVKFKKKPVNRFLVNEENDKYIENGKFKF